MGVRGETTYLGWRLAGPESQPSERWRSITFRKAPWRWIGEREANRETGVDPRWTHGRGRKRDKILDKEETVRKRLDVYVSQTKPLIEYYNNWAQHAETNGLKAPEYRRISGLGTVDEIRARVFDALK